MSVRPEIVFAMCAVLCMACIIVRKRIRGSPKSLKYMLVQNLYETLLPLGIVSVVFMAIGCLVRSHGDDDCCRKRQS